MSRGLSHGPWGRWPPVRRISCVMRSGTDESSEIKSSVPSAMMIVGCHRGCRPGDSPRWRSIAATPGLRTPCRARFQYHSGHYSSWWRSRTRAFRFPPQLGRYPRSRCRLHGRSRHPCCRRPACRTPPRPASRCKGCRRCSRNRAASHRESTSRRSDPARRKRQERCRTYPRTSSAYSRRHWEYRDSHHHTSSARCRCRSRSCHRIRQAHRSHRRRVHRSACSHTHSVCRIHHRSEVQGNRHTPGCRHSRSESTRNSSLGPYRWSACSPAHTAHPGSARSADSASDRCHSYSARTPRTARRWCTQVREHRSCSDRVPLGDRW